MTSPTDGQHRTLTALYHEAAQADRAIARLHEAGIGEAAIRTRRGGACMGDEGRGGLMDGFMDFLMPEADRRGYSDAVGRGGILVIVDDVPAEIGDRALDILDEEAADLHDGWEHSDPERNGAAGTLGGAGRATDTVDRLTGERIGGDAAGGRGTDDEEVRGHGGGFATGDTDRLTGERIGRPPEDVREDRPRRARAYVRPSQR